MPRRCDCLIGATFSAWPASSSSSRHPRPPGIRLRRGLRPRQGPGRRPQTADPGTDDFYYYHALHYLNTEQFDKIEPLTHLWYERHKQTPRLTEIQTRFALLTYEKDPKKSLEYVRHRLGIHFSHQKEQAAEIAHLKGALDQTLIARDTLKKTSLARWGNLNNFEDAALDWMAAEACRGNTAANSVLAHPADVANLPKLVADDLAACTRSRSGPTRSTSR